MQNTNALQTQLVLIETLWNVKVIALIDSIKVTEY